MKVLRRFYFIFDRLVRGGKSHISVDTLAIGNSLPYNSLIPVSPFVVHCSTIGLYVQCSVD
jgi:hypothetical protein